MEIFNIFRTIFILFHQIWNGGDGNGDLNINIHNITNNSEISAALLNSGNGNDNSTVPAAIFVKTFFPPNVFDNNDPQQQQQCGYSSPYFMKITTTKSGKDTKTLKVINGDPVKDIRQFPWMVSIVAKEIPFFHSFFICSGTIISRWHILTAGHCVGFYYFFRGYGLKNWPKLQTKDYLITAGAANRTDVKSEGVQQIRSKWLIPHPNATFSIDRHTKWPLPLLNAKDDIAIIELSQPLNFTDKVQPICLPADDQSAFDKIGIVAGWGKINRKDFPHKNDNDSTEQLHIGQMKIVQDACKKYFYSCELLLRLDFKCNRDENMFMNCRKQKESMQKSISFIFYLLCFMI